MSLFARNVRLGKPIPLSSWRKIAIGTWKSVGDPSVYGMLEVDAGPALAYIEKLRASSGTRVTLSHFSGRAVAEALKRHPAINCILRFGYLFPRESVDIFFQVASDTRGEDLSGMTVRGADGKSVLEIAREMEERVRAIKEKRDRTFDKMKGTMNILPPWLVGPILTFVGFLTYTLNFWTPLLGSPRDPFGSCMITNIGSLGMETAFAPLVPYSRVPLLIALGAAKDAPVVRDGKLAVARMMKMCVTFDHRLIDGVHGSLMAKTILKIFADPESELGLA
jgi:pyruvate/2-oxoglutarate dehydrogenase complex dihydrolipoamide acyltransferase (E2) component